MSFRQFGGINRAATNNIVRNQYSASDKPTIPNTLGQANSKIVSESHIDLSGNSLLNTQTVYFTNGASINNDGGANPNDLTIDGNLLVTGNFMVDGSQIFTGDVVYDNNVTFNSTVTMNDTLLVTGDVSMNVAYSEYLTCGYFGVVETSTFGNTATFNGDVSMNLNLNVTGTVTSNNSFVNNQNDVTTTIYSAAGANDTVITSFSNITGQDTSIIFQVSDSVSGGYVDPLVLNSTNVTCGLPFITNSDISCNSNVSVGNNLTVGNELTVIPSPGVYISTTGSPNVYSSGPYTTYTFTDSGSISFQSLTFTTIDIAYIVVGGGGGGGNGSNPIAGGGGGGGYISASRSYPISASVTGNAYNIVVGGGGGSASAGGQSYFGSIAVASGGYPGSSSAGPNQQSPGGAGGGAGGYGSTIGGQNGAGSIYNGTTTYINGINYFLGGGGGGGSYSPATAGSGSTGAGGGSNTYSSRGGVASNNDFTTYGGGGGGGGWSFGGTAVSNPGGSGASGVVIIVINTSLYTILPTTQVLNTILNDTITTTNIVAADLSASTITTSTITTTSDYRFKCDVSQLDNQFSVDQLKPVTYTNKLLGKQDIGFLAHEVQEVFPYLVNGVKDGPETQSLNYNGLIGVLVKEIQDLKKRIAVLEKNENLLSS